MALKDRAIPMTREVSRDTSLVCNNAVSSLLTQACNRLLLASAARDPKTEPTASKAIQHTDEFRHEKLTKLIRGGELKDKAFEFKNEPCRN